MIKIGEDDGEIRKGNVVDFGEAFRLKVRLREKLIQAAPVLKPVEPHRSQLEILCEKTETGPLDWTQIHGPGINNSVEVWFLHRDGRSVIFDDSNATLFSIVDEHETEFVKKDAELSPSRVLDQLVDYWKAALSRDDGLGMLKDFRAVIEALEEVESKALKDLPIVDGGLNGESPDFWIERLSNAGVMVYLSREFPFKFEFTGCEAYYSSKFAAISAAVLTHIEDVDVSGHRPERDGV